MKTTLTMMLSALLVMTTWANDASAMDYCPDGAGCKSGEVCHSGLCLPAAMICTSDASCANYEKCDFSCPHGGSANATTSVDTSPPSQGSGGSAGGSGGGSDGEAGAGFKAPAEGEEEADSDTPPDGEAKKPGAGEPAPPQESSCPKDKGVCVVVPTKIKADAACKSFCAVVGKCGFSGKVNGGSSPGNSTPGAPPTETTPAPAPDGQDSGSGDGADSGDDDEGGSPGEPIPPEDGEEDQQADPPGGKKAVPDAPSEEMVAANTESCELVCMIWKLKKVAVKELPAVMQCVATNQSKTCDEIDKGCEDEAKAFVDAVEADESWELALGGGWGYSAGSNTSKDVAIGADPEAPGSDGGGEAQNTGAGADGGTYVAGSASGCTAGAVPVSHGGAMAFIIFLLAGAIVSRRRLG